MNTSPPQGRPDDTPPTARSISGPTPDSVTSSSGSLLDIELVDLAERPAERSTAGSIQRLQERTLERTLERTQERTQERATERSLPRPVPRAEDRLVERSLTRPAMATISRTLAGPVSRSFDSAASRPIDGTVSRPLVGTVGRSADGTLGRPIDATVSRTLDGTIGRRADGPAPSAPAALAPAPAVAPRPGLLKRLFSRRKAPKALREAPPSRLDGLRAAVRARCRAFDNRAQRERALIAAAVVAGAFMVADALWLTPAWQHWKSVQSARKTQAAQGSALIDAARVAVLGQRQQIEKLQAERDRVMQRVQDGEGLLRVYDSALIGPDSMLPLLEQMLARHGQVRVREMRTLARTDLLGAPQAAGLPARPVAAGNGAPLAAATTTVSAAAAAVTAAANAASAPSASLADPAQPALYRHGVELTLEGSFVDLMAYVRSLEDMPQRLLWGGMSFRVEQHPTAVLTLRLYTLSSARHWIEI